MLIPGIGDTSMYGRPMSSYKAASTMYKKNGKACAATEMSLLIPKRKRTVVKFADVPDDIRLFDKHNCSLSVSDPGVGKLFRAAAEIQKICRGYVAARKWDRYQKGKPAKKIQRIARGYLARKHVEHIRAGGGNDDTDDDDVTNDAMTTATTTTAATEQHSRLDEEASMRTDEASMRTAMDQQLAARIIQSLYRGWYARMSALELQLAGRTEELEQEREEQLRQVAEWKRGQQAHIEKFVEWDKNRVSRLKMEASLYLDDIDELMKTKKDLKAELASIERQCEELQQANDALGSEYGVYKAGRAKVKQELVEIQNENIQWQHVSDHYEDLVQEYQEVNDEREARQRCEHNIKQSCERAIASILKHVQTFDYDLWTEIEEDGLLGKVRRRFQRRGSFDSLKAAVMPSLNGSSHHNQKEEAKEPPRPAPSRTSSESVSEGFGGSGHRGRRASLT